MVPLQSQESSVTVCLHRQSEYLWSENRSLSSDTIERKESSLVSQNSESTCSYSVAKTRSRRVSLVPFVEQKILISLGTASICLFIFFIAILGGCLIGISVQSTLNSNSLQNGRAESTRAKLLNLTQSSSQLLIQVSRSSIDSLVSQIFSVVNDKVICSIDKYISLAEQCVGQMAFAWSKGHLDGSDLDLTYATLWDFQQQFPDVASFNLADAVHGNFVSVRNLLGGTFEVDLKNTTGSTCSICQAGATGSNKYYYYVAEPYQRTGFVFFKTGQYNALIRPWYLAEAAGNGSGRWAELSGFSSGINVGSSAGKLVHDRHGAPLGVVNSDLELSLLSRYLIEVREDLVNSTASIGPVEHALAAEQLHIALVNHLGLLVGTSTTDSTAALVDGAAQPVTWYAAMALGSMRDGLSAVNTTFGGDWGRALDAGYRTYQTGPGGGLFVSSKPYSSAWGLRLLVVGVCPRLVYRGPFDDAIAGTEAQVASPRLVGSRGRVRGRGSRTRSLAFLPGLRSALSDDCAVGGGAGGRHHGGDAGVHRRAVGGGACQPGHNPGRAT